MGGANSGASWLGVVGRPDSLRQHGLDEVLLQLLVDELELAERLLAPDDAVVNVHSQVVELKKVETKKKV